MRFRVQNIVVERNKARLGENQVEVLESLGQPEALETRIVSIPFI